MRVWNLTKDKENCHYVTHGFHSIVKIIGNLEKLMLPVVVTSWYHLKNVLFRLSNRSKSNIHFKFHF